MSYSRNYHYLADMSTELDAARFLTWKGGLGQEKKKRYSLEAVQAELFSSEMAQHVTDKAIPIHGGYCWMAWKVEIGLPNCSRSFE